MLPHRSNVSPKERAKVDENESGQPYGNQFSDPIEVPDVPGEEMTKNSRVWKAYVKETDRSDKEFVGENNSSLDVLLIFAALFSAISTTFISGSLNDLKPDSAAASAQTLLLISQSLAAIANNQPVSLPDQTTLEAAIFQPSQISIIVNILWITSLTLSVIVSLFAMLAKDWCFKFLSGRYGHAYDQARRRQKRWNAIEMWRMREILKHLPAMLHLALVLFVIGLCVQLWETNTIVAIPIVVVCGLATLVYTLMTTLPYIYPACPYSTPLTNTYVGLALSFAVLGGLFVLMIPLGILAVALLFVGFAVIAGYCLLCFVLFIAGLILMGGLELGTSVTTWFLALIKIIPRDAVEETRSNTSRRILSAWQKFGSILGAPFSLLESAPKQLAGTAMNIWTKSAPSTQTLFDDPELNNLQVSLDSVTGRILAWLLDQNEDLTLINIALQAISGAKTVLGMTPDAREGAIQLVETQLLPFKQLGPNNIKSKKWTVLSTALTYCRTYSLLVHEDAKKYPWDRWTHGNQNQESSDAVEFMRIYLGYVCVKRTVARRLTRCHFVCDSLLEHYMGSHNNDDDVVIAATTTAMQFCHWHGSHKLDLHSLSSDPSVVAETIIRGHFDPNGRTLRRSQMHDMVKSTAHYLIGLWPREQGLLTSRIPALLAQIYLAADPSDPELAWVSAIVLFSATFAMYVYPGGENPPRDVDAREQRSIKTLEYHHGQVVETPKQEPTEARTTELHHIFAFGFLGLLPMIEFDDPKTQLVIISQHISETIDDLNLTNFAGWPIIHGLPHYFTLKQQISITTCRCLRLVANTQVTSRRETNILLSCSILLVPRLDICGSGTQMYASALIAFRHATSSELRDLCVDIINHQPIPLNKAQLLLDDENLLEVLCRSLPIEDGMTSIHDDKLSLVVLHFRLLVVSVMLASGDSLDVRQSLLRPLLNCHPKFAELPFKTNDPPDFHLQAPFWHAKQILEHQSKPKRLLSTMRLVKRFCDLKSGSQTAQALEDKDHGWPTKLQTLKDDFCAGLSEMGQEDHTTSQLVSHVGTQLSLIEDSGPWCPWAPFCVETDGI